MSAAPMLSCAVYADDERVPEARRVAQARAHRAADANALVNTKHPGAQRLGEPPADRPRSASSTTSTSHAGRACRRHRPRPSGSRKALQQAHQPSGAASGPNHGHANPIVRTLITASAARARERDLKRP